jgi:hypothetical protein
LTLALGACPDSATSEGRVALRVPLPEGWRATKVTSGLHVGPAGQVTLQLETLAAPVPSLEQLLALLEHEKVDVISKESNSTYVGVRYRFGESADEGFLGVQQAQGRTVWCSTTRGTKGELMEAAMKVCRALGGELEPRG